MKRLLSAALVGAAFALAAAANAPDAMAGDWFCPDPDGNPSGTVDGNVVVTGTCTLGTVIQGNVKVEPGGVLETSEDTMIFGDLQSNGAASIRLYMTTVMGNAQIYGTTGDTEVELSTISGDLQVYKSEGGVLIKDNTIAGNLQCFENYSVDASGNDTAGNEQGQCLD